MEAKLSKQEIETLSRTPEKCKWYSKIGLALFIMTIPTVVYIFIFHYLPLSGLIIAFKDYSSFKGIFNSDWTSMGGFKHFYTLLPRLIFGLLLKIL